MPASLASILTRPERGIVPALALILTADGMRASRDLARPIEALLDEPSHLATTFLLLTALPVPCSRSFAIGAVLGAVGIDADHVPGELGLHIITRGTGRPVTHSLATCAAVLALSCRLSGGRRMACVGVACGVLAHLVRDIGTGGVPLLWPFSKRRVRVPSGVYVAALIAAGGGGWWRAISRRRASLYHRQHPGASRRDAVA